MTTVGTIHPRTTGPESLDPALLIRCPDCGQMEWWTERECSDHGQCRATSDAEQCPVCY